MGAHEAPKYRTLPGCYCHSPPTRFGVDVEWEHNGIREKASSRGSA